MLTHCCCAPLLRHRRWDFYGSAFADLVSSLVKLSPAPWSLVERILHLCPSVPSSVPSGEAGATGAAAASDIGDGGSEFSGEDGAVGSATSADAGGDRRRGRPTARSIVEVPTRCREAVLAIARFLVLSNGQYAQQLVPRLAGWVRSLPLLASHDQNESYSFALVTLVLQAVRVLNTVGLKVEATRLVGSVLATLDDMCSSDRVRAGLEFLNGTRQKEFRADTIGKSPLLALMGILRALAGGGRDPMEDDVASDSESEDDDIVETVVEDDIDDVDDADTGIQAGTRASRASAVGGISFRRSELEVLPFGIRDVQRTFAALDWFLKPLYEPSKTHARVPGAKLAGLRSVNIKALVMLVMKQLVRAARISPTLASVVPTQSCFAEADRNFKDTSNGDNSNLQEAAVELMVECAVASNDETIWRSVRQIIVSALRRFGLAQDPKLTLLQVLLDGLRELCDARPQEMVAQATSVLRALLLDRDHEKADTSESELPAAMCVGHAVREAAVLVLTHIFRREALLIRVDDEGEKGAVPSRAAAASGGAEGADAGLESKTAGPPPLSLPASGAGPVHFFSSSVQKFMCALSDEIFFLLERLGSTRSKGRGGGRDTSGSSGGEDSDGGFRIVGKRFGAGFSTTDGGGGGKGVRSRARRQRLKTLIRDCLDLLRHLACAVRHPEVIKYAGQLFVEHFSRQPRAWLSQPLVYAMVDVALLDARAPRPDRSIVGGTFSTLTDIFLSQYGGQRPFEVRRTGTSCTAEMPRALLRLAEGLRRRPSAARDEMRRKLLVLFSQLGMAAQRSLKNVKFSEKASTFAAPVGELLPALAESVRPTPHDPKSAVALVLSDAASVKLYRSVWFSIVLFRFHEDNPDWPHEWFRAVRTLAIHSPVLVVRGAFEAQLEMELKAGMARHGTGVETLHVVKAAMRDELPSVRGALDSLETSTFLYTAAVFHLETLRARDGTFKAMFEYLADDGIDRANLSPIVSGISDKVFALFLRQMDKAGRTFGRELVLEDHCQYLVAHCVHRFERIRVAARRYLQNLLDAFPQLRSSKVCLTMLLDAIEAVQQRFERGNDPDYRMQYHRGDVEDLPSGFSDTLAVSAESSGVHDESAPLLLVGCAYPLNVPAVEGKLAGLLMDLVEIASSWLASASTTSIAEVNVFLQEYVKRLRDSKIRLVTTLATSDVRVPHTGVAVALHSAAPTVHPTLAALSSPETAAGGAGAAGRGRTSTGAAGTAPAGVNIALSSMASARGQQLAQSVELRAHYMGLIYGMAAFHATDLSGTARSAVSFESVMKKQFESRFVKLLNGHAEMAVSELSKSRVSHGGLREWLHADTSTAQLTVPGSRFANKEDGGSADEDSLSEESGSELSVEDASAGSAGEESDGEVKAAPPHDSSGTPKARKGLRKAVRLTKTKVKALVRLARAPFHRGDSDSDDDAFFMHLGAPASHARSLPSMAGLTLMSVASKKIVAQSRAKAMKAFATSAAEVMYQSAAFLVWSHESAALAQERRIKRELRSRQQILHDIDHFDEEMAGFRGVALDAPTGTEEAAALSRLYCPTPHLDLDLLHFFAWMPAHCFTAHAMSSAVACWEWVLMAVPSERVRLLSEIAAAWAWSVEHGFGMFSGTAVYNRDGTKKVDPANLEESNDKTALFNPPQAPTSDAYPQDGTGPMPPSLCVIEPHRVWLRFWRERFAVVQTRNSEELAIIFQVVNVALSDISRLSPDPESFGARVALLDLGFRALHAAHESVEHQDRTGKAKSDGRRAPTAVGGAGSGGRIRGGSSDLRLGGVGAWNGGIAGLDERLGDEFDAAASVTAQFVLNSAAPQRRGASPSDERSVSESSDGGEDHMRGFVDPVSGEVGQVGSDTWASTSVGSLALLRQRLLLAALQWFESNPSWYEVATSQKRVEEDFPMLVAFCRLVNQDRRYWYSSDVPDPPGDGSSGELPTASPQLVLSVSEPWAGGRGSRGSMGPGSGRGRRESDGSISSTGSGFAPPMLRPVRSLMNRLSVSNTGDARALATSVGSNSSDGSRARSFERHASLGKIRQGSQSELLRKRGSARTLALSAVDDPGRADGATLGQRRSHLWRARRRTHRGAHGSFHGIVVDRDTSRAGGAAASETRRSARESRAVAWVSRVTQLLMALMSHELDRIVAWHNPANLPHKHLPSEREFTSDDMSYTELQKLVRTAWEVRPSLAVKLLRRYRQSAVRAELEQLVRDDPDAILDEPDAVLLLACEANVASDAPQLRQLAYMAPASFPTILALLSRCNADKNLSAPLFTHRHVALYCVRSMRCFSAETVVFYLPQLVQALRHDRHGILSNFLFGMSQTSVLIAHQLMWLLVTESQVDPPEHGEKHSAARPMHGFQNQLNGEDTLPSIVTALAARIEATFPPTARLLYRREFDFFEKMTEISGKLLKEVKPLKEADATKAKRRAAIKKYLLGLRDEARVNAERSREGATDVGGLGAGAYGALGGGAGVAGSDPSEVLYMPTDPTKRVVSVDIESGNPMQSAAKCPYLLVFRVTAFDGPDATLRAAEAEERRRRRREERRRLRMLESGNVEGHGSRFSRARAEWKGRKGVLDSNMRRVGTKLKRATRKRVRRAATSARKAGSRLKGGVRRVGTKLKRATRPRGQGSRESMDDVLADGEHERSSDEGLTSGSDLASETADVNVDPLDGQDEVHVDVESVGAEESKDAGVEHPSPGGPAARTPSKKRAKSRQPVRQQLARALRMGRKGQHARKPHGVRAPPVAATSVQACIFKVYDDCRQDALAIQVIQLFKAAFDRTGLGLFLYPYRVIPSRTGPDKAVGGIIECVPNVKSRDEIGKDDGSKTLMEYFQNKFGRPDGKPFEVARRNMIRSLAAYAVVCFALQIKDRHNGNLLVDGNGNMIHIDFGFLLGTSPGGNLGFESAAFKLTKEMIEVMGGEQDAEPFLYFVELSIRAFLAARSTMDGVVGLVGGMADSGFPCFHFPDTVSKVRSRFRPDDNDIVASKFMKEQVYDSYNKLSTIIYDGIQKLQNNIHSDAWL